MSGSLAQAAPADEQTGWRADTPMREFALRLNAARTQSEHSPEGTAMDIERINAIGTLLADLADRTQQLRGYL